MLASSVDITSSDTKNGAEGVTLTFGMLLSHNIVAGGSISFDIPKQNYHYWYLGASNRECMLYNCESADLVATVIYTNSKTETEGTSVNLIDNYNCAGSPSDMMDGICFLYEELDTMHDRITLDLDNAAVVPAGKYLIITMYPFKNFPSMAAVEDFQGWTGDSNFKPIEAFTGASYVNQLPGPFSDSSTVTIIASGDSSVTDYYQVASADLSYEFDIYLLYNDVPNYSKFVVTWPSAWSLDCSVEYTVYCTVGCSFANDSAIICDETINGIELYGGFDAGTSTPYLQYQVGHITFVLSGITNPDTTDGMYFTVTSYHQ